MRPLNYTLDQQALQVQSRRLEIRLTIGETYGRTQFINPGNMGFIINFLPISSFELEIITDLPTSRVWNSDKKALPGQPGNMN